MSDEPCAKLSKQVMIDCLPLREGGLLIRPWTREDVDLLGEWPKYSFPYEGLELSFREMPAGERDSAFLARQGRSDLIVLVADHARRPAIAYIALMAIDWKNRRIGNFGFRMHPAWLHRGMGTAILSAVCKWVFTCGVVSIGVDVAASNTGAVRCYEKVGFRRIGEMKREAPDLQKIDLDDVKYDFLRPHVDFDGGVPRLRFWLMEIRSGDVSAL